MPYNAGLSCYQARCLVQVKLKLSIYDSSQSCFVIKVFEGKIDIFVAMQQIVSSHWLLNTFSLIYWSEKPEAKSSCTCMYNLQKQTNQDKCQTKVANHIDVADIVVFRGFFLYFI